MATPFRTGKFPRGLSRRQFLALLGGGAGASLMAACAPGAISTPVSPAATSVISPTGIPATTTPGSSGTGHLVFGYSSPVEQLDPGASNLAGDAKIVFNIYDSLFRSDGFPPNLRGHLAESFQVSDDGREYTFNIRQGVKFHDGTDLTAHDVRYSWVRILELGRAPAVYWSGIVTPDGITVPDDYTVKVQLARPYVPLPDTLMWLYVVNQAQVEAHIVGDDYGVEWLNQSDAGSGPFTITSNEPGVRMQLERYADYWGGWGEKYLDGWVFEVIREPATLRLALQQGSAHMTDLFALSVDDMELAAEGGQIRIEEDPTMAIVQLKMNNQLGPTDNKDFRKAMAYAFSYDSVINDLLRGKTEKAEGVIPKGLRFFKSFAGENEYVTDLDRARSHLAASGFDPKASGPLGYMYRGDDALQRDYGLILQNDLAQLGIELEMQGVTTTVLLERLQSPETAPNFTRISVSTLIIDPDLDCRRLFSSKSWEGLKAPYFAGSFYKNEEVDRLIEEAQFSTDADARAPLYEKIQDIVHDDAVDIWVDQQHWLTAINNNVQGYEYMPLGVRPINMHPIYLEA